jgi:hypothetical protein
MKSLLFLLALIPVHSSERPDLDNWFENLHSEKGACCSFVDGMAIEDVNWESHDGNYRVRLPREKGGHELIWVDVPDDAVIKQPNLYGRAIVWPLYKGASRPFIRCFIPGTMT